ncbi:MAG TPA: hypothetical protein VFL41_07350 [Gaiellaceae bacterium]|nr:hypothetical protein [Gaiellaceae bacterium]
MKIFGPNGEPLSSIRLVLSELDAENWNNDVPEYLEHVRAERDEAERRGETYHLEVTVFIEAD